MNQKNKVIILLIIISICALNAPTTLGQVIDTDQDGLSDEAENNIYYTNPELADTDNDGYNDGHEVKHGYSPLIAGDAKLNQIDTDNDGLKDDWEIKLGADLKNPDTDNDGYNDGHEVEHGYLPTKKGGDKTNKKIIVNLAKQTLAYYLGDILLEEFLISSGLPRFQTPVGDFVILNKLPVKNYKGPGYYFPNTKWNLHFATGKNGRFYIHGAYWHNSFGKPKSHGCVNVSYANMERLYNFAQLSTVVKISKK